LLLSSSLTLRKAFSIKIAMEPSYACCRLFSKSADVKAHVPGLWPFQDTISKVTVKTAKREDIRHLLYSNPLFFILLANPSFTKSCYEDMHVCCPQSSKTTTRYDHSTCPSSSSKNILEQWDILSLRQYNREDGGHRARSKHFKEGAAAHMMGLRLRFSAKLLSCVSKRNAERRAEGSFVHSFAP
jgi:hypothetical protein